MCLQLSQPERRVLAGVEDLGGAEEGEEGSEIAFNLQGSHEAAEGHLGVLAVTVAFPIVPAQVSGGDADVVGAMEKGFEVPVDVRTGDVEPGDFEGAAEHVESEDAEVEGGGEPAPVVDAEGCEEVEEGSFNVATVLLGMAGLESGGAVGAAVFEEGVPGAVGREGAGVMEGEGGAAVAQAGGGHAFDGEEDVGLKLGGLAEEEEVEREGIAGREVAGVVSGLDDEGTRGGVEPAQEGRRCAFDEGLEDPGVDAGLAQAAGGARLVRTQDADGAAQGMAEGTAEHGAFVRRKVGGGLGLEG